MSLTIVDWKPGLKRLLLADVLRRTNHLNPQQAKAAVDSIVDGRPFRVDCPAGAAAEAARAQLERCGAICRVDEQAKTV